MFDFIVDIGSDQDVSLEIGNWEDLEILIEKLNGYFEGYEYRLEKVQSKIGLYIFIEDPLKEDSYGGGLVIKHKGKAYAYSADVHDMIMGAYNKYLKETGETS